MIAMTGKRFGRLVVLTEAGRDPWRQIMWHCQCDCGCTANIRGYSLRSGATKSCGCLSSETTAARNVRSIKHGATTGEKFWPEYAIWRGMLTRCYNPRFKKYRLYGGRGIMVCDRWRFGEQGKHPFECFIEDVGRRPFDDLSIDRYPNKNGNYEPNNVRWATMSEQNGNRNTYARRQKLSQERVSK